MNVTGSLCLTSSSGVFPAGMPAGANWIQKIKYLQICTRGGGSARLLMHTPTNLSTSTAPRCTYLRYVTFSGLLACIPLSRRIVGWLLGIPCCYWAEMVYSYIFYILTMTNGFRHIVRESRLKGSFDVL